MRLLRPLRGLSEVFPFGAIFPEGSLVATRFGVFQGENFLADSPFWGVTLGFGVFLVFWGFWPKTYSVSVVLGKIFPSEFWLRAK